MTQQSWRQLLRPHSPFLLRLGERAAWLYSSRGILVETVLFETDIPLLSEEDYLAAVIEASKRFSYRGCIELLLGGLRGLSKVVSIQDQNIGKGYRNLRQAIACEGLPHLSLSEKVLWQSGELGTNEYFFVGFKEKFLKTLDEGLDQLGFEVCRIWPAAWCDYLEAKRFFPRPILIIEAGMAQLFDFKESHLIYTRFAWEEVLGLTQECQRLMSKVTWSPIYLKVKIWQGLTDEEHLVLRESFKALDIEEWTDFYKVPEKGHLELRSGALLRRGRLRRALSYYQNLFLWILSITLIIFAYPLGKLSICFWEEKKLLSEWGETLSLYHNTRALHESIASVSLDLEAARKKKTSRQELPQFILDLKNLAQDIGKIYVEEADLKKEQGGISGFLRAIILKNESEGEAALRAYTDGLQKLCKHYAIQSFQWDNWEDLKRHCFVIELKLGDIE